MRCILSRNLRGKNHPPQPCLLLPLWRPLCCRPQIFFSATGNNGTDEKFLQKYHGRIDRSSYKDARAFKKLDFYDIIDYHRCHRWSCHRCLSLLYLWRRRFHVKFDQTRPYTPHMSLLEGRKAKALHTLSIKMFFVFIFLKGKICIMLHNSYIRTD